MSDQRSKLQDATAAFTFSRLPREERVANIIANILFANHVLPNWPLTSWDVRLTGEINLMSIGEELAQYSVKDFAVRYGHLADGKN